MTTTDAAKLREAANWVLQQDDNCEQDELLARHVLATVPEDGEGMVDEAWLREQLGIPCGDMLVDRIWFLNSPSDEYGEVSVWLHSGSLADMRRITRITTRSQFRCLMTALGIQPTKTDSKL